MYVVAGVTGRPVRVLVRDPEKGEEWRRRGAEVAVASLDDAPAVSRALAGAEGAYLLVPPAYADEDVLGRQARFVAAMADAVRTSGVPHVVLLSSVGAQHASGIGLILALHGAEQAMRPAARNLTILRASYFLENWAPVLPQAREKGVLPTFLTPDRRIPMIATRDIGRAAARALAEPPEKPGARILRLAGPRDWSPHDVAREVGAILAGEVRLLPLPIDAAAPAMRSLGMSGNGAALFQEMTGAVNSGLVAFDDGPVDEDWRGVLGIADVLRPILDAGGSEGV
jgi:uncharacterized protein YbjT (DUF2867 family)